MAKKIDGRKLDPATQAHLRRSIVLAVRAGMTQTEAARTFGLSLRAVSKIHGAGQGWRAARPETRPSRSSARLRSTDVEAGPTDPAVDRWQDARSVEVAVLSVDTGSGGDPDRARIRYDGLDDLGRALPEGLGHEPAKAGAACLRAQRLGDCALVAPGVSGDRARSKTPGRHDLLG